MAWQIEWNSILGSFLISMQGGHPNDSNTFFKLPAAHISGSLEIETALNRLSVLFSGRYPQTS